MEHLRHQTSIAKAIARGRDKPSDDSAIGGVALPFSTGSIRFAHFVTGLTPLGIPFLS
jgi:hypothetical protein